MRVLYLGNPISDGIRALGEPVSNCGAGWITGLLNSIVNIEECEIGYSFFYGNMNKTVKSEFGQITYYIMPLNNHTEENISEYELSEMSYVLADFKPDVIHIFGTERKKTLNMLKVAGVEKCIISITGLISICAKHYYGGIEKRNLYAKTINDVLRRMSPVIQKKKFDNLGRTEIETLSICKYVFGRTQWDYACVTQINPDIKYFYSGEILQNAFYETQWNIKNIEQHSIFVSQGSYPLKGLHMAIETLSIIVNKYSDAHLYVAGTNLTDNSNFISRIKRTTYGRYLIKTIKKYRLEDHITFLGPLNEEKMCKQYLKSHIFFLPSLIENSSNSLGEAMLLGVPCVASYVGGTPDLLRSSHEGFLYPYDEPYMAAYYICKIFDSNETASNISIKARNIALERYCKERIVEDTFNAYKYIVSNNKKS